MPLPRQEAWFAAKSYGWGWGLPLRWQGWAVMIAFMLIVSGGGIVFSPAKHPLLFFVMIGSSAAALLGICWWKGEKPGWRWGDE